MNSDEDYHYLCVKAGRWINLENVKEIHYIDHEHTMSCGCHIDFFHVGWRSTGYKEERGFYWTSTGYKGE